MFSTFKPTQKGKEYIAQSLTGKRMVFTKGAFGNGILPEGTSPSSVTELVNKLGTMLVSDKNASGGKTIIGTQFSNRVNGAILEPFHLTEIALYAKLQTLDDVDDPDGPEALVLYSYTTTEQSDYIPAILTEFLINWPLEVSESANITVVIDDSLAYPTLKQFNESISHKVTASGSGSALTTVLTGIALEDNLQLTVKLTADLAENATLKFNNSTAYPIKGLDGKNVKKGPKAGSWLNLIYSESDSCWYMLGGGSSIEVATSEEAQAGTDDEKVMTPAKTKVYVDKVVGAIGSILDAINGTSL